MQTFRPWSGDQIGYFGIAEHRQPLNELAGEPDRRRAGTCMQQVVGIQRLPDCRPVTQFQIQGSGDHGLRRQETAQREGQTVRLRGRHYGAEIAGHYNTTRFALPDRVLRCR